MNGAVRQWPLARGLMGRPQLLRLLVGTCVILMFVPKLPDIKYASTFPKPVKSGNFESSINDQAGDIVEGTRRRMATIVQAVQKQLQRLAGKKAVIDARLALELAMVAAKLDPRMSFAADSFTSHQSTSRHETRPSPQFSNRTRHVCSEVYDNSSGESYLPVNISSRNCTDVPNFKDVLTVILPAYDWKPGAANFVVKQIRKLYDIPVIVIVSPNDKVDQNLKVDSILKHKENVSAVEIVNSAVRMIKTPYVFLGISLAHFDTHSTLERLVQVLDELEQVKVVGGAARDNQGRWIHGCLQLRMVYYQAYYASGYYYSIKGCMYCDDLMSSFVTLKKLLLEIPLANKFNGPALYRDWFAKVREKGYLVVTCPDVMFYVDKHVTMGRSDWLMFCKQWELEKVHAFDKKVYNFTCDAVEISCKMPLDHIRSYVLPPCCRAVMEKYIAALTEYGDKNNLDYELNVGSVLGAVKMGSYLPWDYDMDVYCHRSDYKKWLAVAKAPALKRCRKLINIRGIYITLLCPYFFLELYCMKRLSREEVLPAKYRNISTSIKYAGHEVKVIANPGRYCRTNMGFEILRHTGHWRTQLTSDHALAKGGYEYPGVWNRCKNRKHHSCLDHFPGDGNLPFLEPFLFL